MMKMSTRLSLDRAHQLMRRRRAGQQQQLARHPHRGTITAVTNNAVGVAGVAYGARVQPVRVPGKCGARAFYSNYGAKVDISAPAPPTSAEVEPNETPATS
jgi:subtilisin family serine protease